MVTAVENDLQSVELMRAGATGPAGRTAVRLLGQVAVLHDGAAARLPKSRKVRALLGYLAMSRRPVLRSWLCDLLWDAVSDPRGELRWCLSKLRRVLGARADALVSDGEWLALDRAAVAVDAVRFLAEAARLREAGGIEELRAADALHTGEILADLGPGLTQCFDNWLMDQREQVALAHRAILGRIAALLPLDAPERVHVLRRLIGRSPFDDAAHADLLRSLVARHEFGEAAQHLSATLSCYRNDGIDESALLGAWRAMRPNGRRPDPPCAAAPDEQGPASDRARFEIESRLPVVAIAPFAAAAPGDADIARFLTHDVTVGLARLRSPFVVSQNSAFVLAERGLAPAEIGRSVNADYIVTGTISRDRSKIRAGLDLTAAGSERLIWSDEVEVPCGDTPDAANEIGAMITAALAAEIELTECHRALLRPVASLNAWEAHHRGLWHLHRFTRTDNEVAIGFFHRAAQLDPTLSRCFAGLSYAHWMNAFAFRPADKDAELRLALDAASRGLHADPKDPAALWSMSRALWMSNDERGAARTIEQAIDLSPSFALARHSRSFGECQTGDPERAIHDSRIAERLSPFDPWRYAMYGVRAFAYLRLGDRQGAAEAARRLTRMPNAHVQARGLAALVLAACGELAQARREVRVVRSLRPSYRLRDFFSAYHVSSDMKARFQRAGLRIGLQG